MRYLYRATPLALEFKQVFKERTGPKLPSIVNKNLTVLPWDWELPSTILKSEWASKHEQCFGMLSSAIDGKESYCGSGLLLHYYGYKHGMSWGPFYERLHGIDTEANKKILIEIGKRIPYFNDKIGLNYYGIGHSISFEGV